MLFGFREWREWKRWEEDGATEEQEDGGDEGASQQRKDKKAKKHRKQHADDEASEKPPRAQAEEGAAADAPARDRPAVDAAAGTGTATEPKPNPYLPAPRPGAAPAVDRRLPTFSFGRPRRKLNLVPTETHTVFVGMLPYACDRASLEKHFAACGLVTRSTLLKRPDGSASGAALVDFATATAADKAVKELNGSQFQGRSIRVDLGSKPGTNATPTNTGTQPTPASTGTSAGAGSNAPPQPADPAPAADPAGDPGAAHSVHLSWFGDAVPEEEIRAVFGKAGAILSVKLVAKAGFGFVDYATQGEAQAALEMDGVVVGDSKVRVQLKQGKKKNKTKPTEDRNTKQDPPQPERKSTVVAAQRTGAIVAPAGKAIKFDSDSE
mmetsp:Transcript_25093/g.64091  ORF Transcript_25093/g.64091 Transcript_25093/m.64091 type:complete len:380 (-) Transcript_25093:13-1152(-)